MWIDGILVLDLSARGVVEGRCTNADLDKMYDDLAIGNVHVGELYWYDSTPTWTLDFDDFHRWRDT
jgi:hypothetical protein